MTDPENNYPSYEAPDTIEGLTEDIRRREAERRRAFDKAYQAVKNAETDEEKVDAFAHLCEMDKIHEDFRKLYPEIFRDEEEQ